MKMLVDTDNFLNMKADNRYIGR